MAKLKTINVSLFPELRLTLMYLDTCIDTIAIASQYLQAFRPTDAALQYTNFRDPLELNCETEFLETFPPQNGFIARSTPFSTNRITTIKLTVAASWEQWL